MRMVAGHGGAAGVGVRRVTCVIVNWNGGADTDACLRSLEADVTNLPAGLGLRVVVVDNGSTDESFELLKTKWPGAGTLHVEFVANRVNAGFPRACNVGVRLALAEGAELLWLLNNDTVVEPGTTAKLVAAMERSDHLGVVGAVLYRMDAPAIMQAWGGGRVSRWTGYNTHFAGPAALGRDAYLTFACALIRRECYEELGGLYEGAFMYFEDSDFCLRARAAGWDLGAAEGTRVLHKEGGAGGPRPQRDRIITTAGLKFLERHSPLPWFSYWIFLAMRLGRRLLWGDWAGLRAVWDGAGDWWSSRRHPD